jgi:UDP-N-acetylmuramoyl-tripeptide--D-alanyl-D-alanine ligase
MLIVSDTVKALGQLANCYRKKFDIPVVAITGSSGKTTTKEMAKQVLSTEYRVLSTEGNLNNYIGVPMTLFRLQPKHDVAVIEMGMNHYGEIQNLCEIAEPTHGMITNVGKAHLEFFGSIQNIARAKGELFNWLGKKKSRTGFVNADDAHVVRQSKVLHRKVSYGFSSKQAEVRGKLLNIDEQGRAKLRISNANRKFDVQLSMQGEHNAANALAAAAVGLHFGITDKKITSVLERVQPIKYRMETKLIGGITIINDAYNANPDSVSVALKSLTTMKCSGKKIVVLGDMLELGEQSKKEHRAIGMLIRKLGLDELYTYGKDSKAMKGKHFSSKAILVNELMAKVRAGDIVLVKGSRGMKMEEVVEQLEAKLKRKVT